MTESENNYRWKNILIMAGIMVVSLVIMVLSPSYANSPYEHFLGAVAESLLVGGLLGFIFELILRKDILKIVSEMQQAIDTNRRWGDVSRVLGLSQILKSDRDLDTRSLVKDAFRLTIIMNDGRTWLSTHENDFEDRMARPETETTVYLIHPESGYLSSLSKKVDSPIELLQSKIHESIDLLRKLAKNGHALRVYGHFLPATYSLIHTEKFSCHIPYPIGRKVEQVPIFVYEKKADQAGFYDSIVRDIEVIHQHALELYPNRQMFIPDGKLSSDLLLAERSPQIESQKNRRKAVRK